MAQTKVSDLTALTSPDGSEELLVNDGGTSKKVTIDNLLYDESIDSDHYVDGSIDEEHIADDAVTADKLANSINSAIAANTAKTTNATHTGDVTGSGALTIAAGAVDIAHLSATGTAGSSNFLRGDNSWVTPTDTNTMGSGFTVSATTDSNATTITQGDDLMFTAGTGITCETTADGTVTITNTVSDTNTMGSGFTVSATTDSNATTITQGDDLMFTAGTGITTETTADGTVTIASTITGGIASLVADTTPQLGGALDGQDNTVSKINLKDYGIVTNAVGGGGGTLAIDLTAGNSVTATVETSTTTFTFSNPTASDELCIFSLVLTNGGSQTVVFPASVDWEGGSAPSLTTSGTDILVFATVDGGTIWHGQSYSLDSKTPS